MKELAKPENQHDGTEDKRRSKSKDMIDRQPFFAFHADRIFFDLAFVPDVLLQTFFQILALAQGKQQLIRFLVRFLEILFVPDRQKLIDLSRKSIGFFFVVETLCLGLLESNLICTNITGRARQLAERLTGQVGHVGQTLVIEQRFLVVFAQPKSLCVLDELLLCL